MRSLFLITAFISFVTALAAHYFGEDWSFSAYLSLWSLLNVIYMDGKGKQDA
jgi:hypothetical protein